MAKYFKNVIQFAMHTYPKSIPSNSAQHRHAETVFMLNKKSVWFCLIAANESGGYKFLQMYTKRYNLLSWKNRSRVLYRTQCVLETSESQLCSGLSH